MTAPVSPSNNRKQNKTGEHLKAWRERGGVRGETRSPIEKSEQNPTSLRLAINAKCYDCQGQDADPGWRQRIADCNDVACPLVPVRPYQKLGKS